MKRKNAIIISAVLILILVVIVVVALIRDSHVIHNVGTIKTVGVGAYWDLACTTNCTTIDWGILDYQMPENRSIYIRNECNVNGTLDVNVTAWTPPEAEQCLMFLWNYSGQTLQPSEVLSVTLTLTVVDFDNVTSFGFDICIFIVT